MSDEDAFRGIWTITEMELWRRDTFELLGPAFFEFEDERLGQFRFVAVEGSLDCRFGKRGGKPLVEFSWEGLDENDPACGRGWALIVGETLSGRIFIHHGDDSSFRAARGRVSAGGGRRRTAR